MANADTPRGLVPVRMASGTPYCGAANRYHVPAANAAALFQGDPVVITGSADGKGVPSVARAAATGAFTGVIVGFEPTTTRDQLGYIPATTEGYVYVADDPGLECEMQVSAAIAANDIGLNAGFVIADGDPVYRRSNVLLNAGSKATTATLPVKILSIMQREDVEPFTADAKVLVKFNNATRGTNTGGV